jgi:hypothetical protein
MKTEGEPVEFRYKPRLTFVTKNIYNNQICVGSMKNVTQIARAHYNIIWNEYI